MTDPNLSENFEEVELVDLDNRLKKGELQQMVRLLSELFAVYFVRGKDTGRIYLKSQALRRG